MALKIILIIVAIIICLIVVVPFLLNMLGVTTFQFGSAGGGSASAQSIPLVRSLDGGQTWVSVAVSEDKRISFPGEVYSLTFSPFNSNVMYLGARGSGVWKSENGGMEWKKVTDKSNALDPRADVYHVVFSRTNPKLLFLVVYQNNKGSILKSEDEGYSFREIYSSTVTRAVIYDVFVDPVDAMRLIVITGQKGMFESGDGGTSWRVVHWFAESPVTLAVNPIASQEMYVVTASGKLVTSVDGGEHWVEVKKKVATTQGRVYSPPGFNPFFGTGNKRSEDLWALDSLDFNTIYNASGDGFFRSRDAGATWEKLSILIPDNSTPITAISVHPLASNMIYVGAANQLHRTNDGGATWNFRLLSTNRTIKVIYFLPVHPEIMFAILSK